MEVLLIHDWPIVSPIERYILFHEYLSNWHFLVMLTDDTSWFPGSHWSSSQTLEESFIFSLFNVYINWYMISMWVYQYPINYWTCPFAECWLILHTLFLLRSIWSCIIMLLYNSINNNIAETIAHTIKIDVKTWHIWIICHNITFQFHPHLSIIIYMYGVS